MSISDSFEAATATLRRDFLRQVIAGFGALNLPHVPGNHLSALGNRYEPQVPG
jgi:hypothetical protein